MGNYFPRKYYRVHTELMYEENGVLHFFIYHYSVDHLLLKLIDIVRGKGE